MAWNTIKIKGPSGGQEENIAQAAIIPGFLCEPTTTAGTFKKHAVAGGAAERIFALENELQGEGIDDAYAANDIAQFGYFQGGDEAYALIADGENIAIADKLESNGDGYLRKVVTDSSALTVEVGSIVGRAIEAIDMSDSSGADPASQRCRIKIW